MSYLIVIPARMESKRLYGKPLLRYEGKSLLHYVWENAIQVENATVIVTSDSLEIDQECDRIGAHFIESPETCQNGTQRSAYILDLIQTSTFYAGAWGIDLPILKAVINLQVDEPEITAIQIEKLARSVRANLPYIYTLHAWGKKRSITMDPNAVKIWLDGKNCNYFSRTPMLGHRPIHIGVYAYSPLVLTELGKIKPTADAVQHSLEQLTWLAHDYSIKSQRIPDVPVSVNTLSDWDAFCKKQSRQAT